MKLTRLSSEEREYSCLNCKHHYKAKGGVGLEFGSSHMCNFGTKIVQTTKTNQNGHIRNDGWTWDKAPELCEVVSKGTGKCKNLARKYPGRWLAIAKKEQQ